MSFFKDVGNFVTKTIPKVFTKDIPKAAEDVGRTIVREVPKVAKDVEQFVTEDVPKGIVTIVDQDRTRKEVDRLRKEETQARADMDSAFQRFDASAKTLMKTEALYRARLEDFTKVAGTKAAQTVLKDVPNIDYDHPGSGFDKVMKGIGDGTMEVVKFVTFDLSNYIFEPFELEKERSHIKDELVKIYAMTGRAKRAEASMVQATKVMTDTIETFEQELRERGVAVIDDDAADRLRVEDIELEVKRGTARTMRRDGLDDALIMRITGLTSDDLAKLE